MAGVEIKNLTRRAVPRFAYTKVQEEVLPDWDISLVFVGPRKARELNMQLRHKEYVPNVLSYVAGEKSGEIIICMSEALKQAPEHEMNGSDFIAYLFIHGALHIKGWAHGGRMEACERKLFATFAKSPGRALSSHVTKNSNRHRHRDVPSKSGRR